MKHYTVEITNEALADMEQLYNHIAYVLQAPENAMDQYNRIADAILTLDIMAERIRIMESEPERSKEMRRLLVDNYSVFFVIQGDKVIVTDGAFRRCDKAEWRRHSACPHHHLWLTLPEPLTDRQQGRSCRGKIQSVLSCDPYYP